jgi:hypothetical protein
MLITRHSVLLSEALCSVTIPKVAVLKVGGWLEI